MSFQWNLRGTPCPIVEFHDVRTERFGAERYLELAETAAGTRPIGPFRISGHPDRLLLVRGYASVLERRKALTAHYDSAAWAAIRGPSADLVRQHEVSLTRAITPAEGIGPLPPGTATVAMISELRFAEQVGSYHLWLRLLLRKAGMDPAAAFATLEAVNDVPAVPVVRNRTQHIVLMAQGGRVPELPTELRGMLRFAPEVLELEAAGALVW